MADHSREDWAHEKNALVEDYGTKEIFIGS